MARRHIAVGVDVSDGEFQVAEADETVPSANTKDDLDPAFPGALFQLVVGLTPADSVAVIGIVAWDENPDQRISVRRGDRGDFHLRGMLDAPDGGGID